MLRVSASVSRLADSQRGLADRLPVPAGLEVVNLASGEPSFGTPEYVMEAANRAMADGFTHYPPAQGDASLREAIAAHQSRMSGVPVSHSEVLVTNGGTGAIVAAMMALLDAGDEVILLDPMYSLYADVVRVVGARAVPVALTSSFGIDPEAIRSALTPNTRMLVLNYPSNPTGRLLTRAELDEIAAIATERDLTVLSDEVYDHIVFAGRHLSALGHPGLAGRTILINSFSKTYAMTGWRVGWLIAKGELMAPILAVARSAQGPPNYIAQRAALAAIADESSGRAWRAWMLERYRTQRDAMLEGLSTIPGLHAGEPEAAFYAWVRYDAPLPATEMVGHLFARGLNTRPGSEFGTKGEGYLRLSFSPDVRVIREGVAILRDALAEVDRT